ncbi:hypothetical protein CM240_0544 [Clostridium bornimense]|uniref:Prepilin-type N-terminal cleavage/methylation domain-containing protein n=1 Tax=Clostridium bornimense TaxID=1216932 RepID=W6RVS2_9CLOT|nr:prepilin-type N-terminal cleavage/methylation domain-containing protein [Clostridium bornimense]CDM67709.1 hypothetical protein CM240_0544 [Clostridium bornimense]
MKKKVKGMTLIEVLISISIFTIILSVIYLFSFSSNRILSDADVKEQLQSEGHKIEDKITTLGMETTNIIDINDFHNNSLMSLKEGDVKAIKFNIATIDSSDAIVHKEVIFKYDEGNKSIYYGESTDPDIMTSNTISGLTLLSSNVDSFQVKSTEVDKTVTTVTGTLPVVKDLKDTKSIEIILTLSKKKGYSNITREISTIIEFRN